MKKIKYLLMIIAVSMLLTGCVKFNATMDIHKDKSMEFSIIYAFDKTIFGEGNGLKEEDVKDAEKQGFTIKKYSEGNFEGFTLTRKINNIDEVSTESDVIYNLSGMMEEDTDNKYIFKVVKSDDKNTYYAKLKFDSSDSGLNTDDTDDTTDVLPDENDDPLTTGSNESGSLDDMDLSGLMKNLDLSFSVKLPNSALSSNATTKEKNDKNLTWKLNTKGEEYIEFAFELSNNAKDSNMLYIGIGALALVVGVVIFLLLSKKKDNNVPQAPVDKSDSKELESEPEPVSKDNN